MTTSKTTFLPRLNTLASVVAGIGKLLGDGTGDIVLAPVESTEARARAARLFAEALHEDSNYEMDWLWYSANMANDAQRRFCLERALYINPDSETAKRTLAKLIAKGND